MSRKHDQPSAALDEAWGKDIFDSEVGAVGLTGFPTLC